MKKHKKNLGSLSTRALLARRRALAGRLGGVEQMLAGSLVQQTRRCGKPGCRCAEGDPHGPYAYFAPRTQGRGRLRYVPGPLVEVVASYLRRGEQVEAVLAQITAINAELLTRRELR
jgi:DNA-binding FrmR family transcriptional regulator